MSQGLKERNKVRERFGFRPLTETEHKLDQKGLKQTYCKPYFNSDQNVYVFEAQPLSNAKTQRVTAKSVDEAVNKLK